MIRQLLLSLCLLICWLNGPQLLALSGIIINHDVKQKKVSISLGKSHGITVGTYLYVYKPRKRKRSTKKPLRGKRVALIKVILVDQNESIAKVHRLHRKVRNLTNFIVWYDELTVQKSTNAFKLIPRIQFFAGGGAGKMSGVEFLRDRWVPEPESAALANNKELTDAKDISNVTVFFGSGEFILYPLSFSRMRNFWTDMLGVGVSGKYGVTASFEDYAGPHLIEPFTANIGEDVTLKGTFYDINSDIRFRFGKTFTKDLYLSLILKLIPFNNHRISFKSQTSPSAAHYKSFTYTFMKFGLEGEIIATRYFNLRTFFHYPLPFASSVDVNWEKEEYPKDGDPSGFLRLIDYSEPFTYQFGFHAGAGYKAFRFEAYFHMSDFRAYCNDGLDPSRATDTDTGTYETVERWMVGGASLGASF